MNELLILILSIALGQSPDMALNENEVALTELPRECVAEYDPAFRFAGNAAVTRICRCDINGDGSEELLVWTGDFGSGGEMWSVMTKCGKIWRRTGQVFGFLHLVDKPPYRGLLVETPCGWESAKWEYYQLCEDKLHSKLKLEIDYREPEKHILRTRPAAIKIED